MGRGATRPRRQNTVQGGRQEAAATAVATPAAGGGGGGADATASRAHPPGGGDPRGRSRPAAAAAAATTDDIDADRRARAHPERRAAGSRPGGRDRGSEGAARRRWHTQTRQRAAGHATHSPPTAPHGEARWNRPKREAGA